MAGPSAPRPRCGLQDVCGYLDGLRRLGHRVPSSTLDSLLLCFAGAERGKGRGRGLALQDCGAQQLVAVVSRFNVLRAGAIGWTSARL